MTVQFSVAVRNGRLDSIETTIGASAILKIRTGAQPANCAAADSGTVLATCNLPADWMAAAASGQKAKSGTWEDTSADATGTAGHFRLLIPDRVREDRLRKLWDQYWQEEEDIEMILLAA